MPQPASPGIHEPEIFVEGVPLFAASQAAAASLLRAYFSLRLQEARSSAAVQSEAMAEGFIEYFYPAGAERWQAEWLAGGNFPYSGVGGGVAEWFDQRPHD